MKTFTSALLKLFSFSWWNFIAFFYFKGAFGTKLKSQFILLFGLFLLLYMSLTARFGTIHESHCTISLLLLSIVLSVKSFQF